MEASLKRLQTDHLDLLHLHSLGDEADLAKIEAPDGAIKALYELREQKVTRFIGMTSHTDGAVMAKAIEHNDLDCVQMAMNPARAARFEELALPAANKKNLGVILMKVTGQDKLMVDGGADTASLLRYAWSLPISTAVCGMPTLEFLEANVATAKAYASPMPPAEMERLRLQLAGRKFVLEQFFAHHHDGGCSRSRGVVPREFPAEMARALLGAFNPSPAVRRPRGLGWLAPLAAAVWPPPPPRGRGTRGARARAATTISHGASQTPFTTLAPPGGAADRQQADGRGRGPAGPSTRSGATAGAGAGRAGATTQAPGAARRGRPPGPIAAGARRGRGRRRATPATGRAAGSPRRGRRATAS